MDALILAGGKGTRIKSITGDAPKQLLLVNDQTIIERLVLQLHEHGVECFFVSVQKDNNQLKDHLSDLSTRYPIQFQFLPTRGNKAADFVALINRALDDEAPYHLIVMGDCVFAKGEVAKFLNINYKRILNSHGMISGVLQESEAKEGAVCYDPKSKIFTRKNVVGAYPSAGIYIAESEALELIRKVYGVNDTSMFQLINKSIRNGNDIYLSFIEHSFDINSPERYENCLKLIPLLDDSDNNFE